MSDLTVEQRLAAIEASGWYLAWDGCHKIYLLATVDQVTDAAETGYQIRPAASVRRLWAESCGLEFVNTWPLTGDGDDGSQWEIRQFESQEEQS